MNRRLMVAAVFAVFVLALATMVMAADPHVGTWKLNLAKSKYSPGPAPRSSTVKFEAQDNGYKRVADGVNAEGQATHNESTVKYDGRAYPLTGSPTADTIAVRKIDANTFDAVAKKAGKEVGKVREVYSKDGKTVTVTTKAKNAQGLDVNNTVVFDKQ